ncbi:YwmB family TATA-box binding protein [Paenibacillus tarimensis]
MNRPSTRTNAKGINGIVLALLILILAAVWIGSGERIAPDHTATGANPLLNDMRKLWSWADPLLEGGSAAAGWSVRWDGFSGDAGITGLGKALGLPTDGLVASGNINVSKELDEGWVRLWYTGDVRDEAGNGTVVMIFEGHAEQSNESLLDRIARMEEVLQEQDITITASSLSFRGTTNREHAQRSIAKQAGAKLIERYEDGNTVSETYYSKELLLKAVSGIQQVNLQLAEHTDPETGRRRLIGGIPLITGDYSREPEPVHE